MNYIKTITNQARQRGTTLIELSVVIAVLLLLVGVLFIGITAWKNGANTAACVVNLSSIQKAARGYANMNGLNAGDGETSAALQTAGFWAAAPACPTGVAYTWTAVVPTQGVPYATCSVSGHAPSATNLANW
jgi:prepilin-type N-terminal cleavage/methylation domain-containing protein